MAEDSRVRIVNVELDRRGEDPEDLHFDIREPTRVCITLRIEVDGEERAVDLRVTQVGSIVVEDQETMLDLIEPINLVEAADRFFAAPSADD